MRILAHLSLLNDLLNHECIEIEVYMNTAQGIVFHVLSSYCCCLDHRFHPVFLFHGLVDGTFATLQVLSLVLSKERVTTLADQVVF